MDLRIEIAGIRFNNPCILASGPLSNTGAALLKAEETGVGGVVTKSATMLLKYRLRSLRCMKSSAPPGGRR